MSNLTSFPPGLKPSPTPPDPMIGLLGEMARLRILFRADSGAAALCIRNGLSPRDLFRPFVREIPRVAEFRSINDTHLRATKMSLKLHLLEEIDGVSPKPVAEPDLSRLVAAHCPGPSFDPDLVFTASSEYLTHAFAQRYWGPLLLSGRDSLPKIAPEHQALQRHGGVPWYALYRSRYVASLPVSEHEFVAHPVAALCVLSAHAQDPRASFAQLYNPSVLTNAWQRHHMHADIPAFVVLLHDPSLPDGPSEARLRELAAAFGPCCRVVTVNSVAKGSADEDAARVAWPERFAACFQRIAEDLEPQFDAQPRETCLISAADCKGIELAMETFAFSFLLPLLERTLHLLNEHVNALRRNSSTLRSWWSRLRTGKSEASASGVNPAALSRSDGDAALADASLYLMLSGTVQSPATYQFGYDLSKTSLNRSVKELADLLFLMGDYDNAQQQYKACANDFKNEGEWHYYAGCLELSALCSIASHLTHRQRDLSVEADFEKAITYYSKLASEGYLAFATRASFFLVHLLRLKSKYRDSADILSRLASMVCFFYLFIYLFIFIIYYILIY